MAQRRRNCDGALVHRSFITAEYLAKHRRAGAVPATWRVAKALLEKLQRGRAETTLLLGNVDENSIMLAAINNIDVIDEQR